MIRNTRQNWTIGNQVKVGFLSLIVVAAKETPGDYLPDAYLLRRGDVFYEFVPHNGLTRLDAGEHAGWM